MCCRVFCGENNRWLGAQGINYEGESPLVPLTNTAMGPDPLGTMTVCVIPAQSRLVITSSNLWRSLKIFIKRHAPVNLYHYSLATAFATHEFHETCHPVTFIVLVNSRQRWKQMRNRVCFHLWCELTSTMNVTEWQVSWTSCPSRFTVDRLSHVTLFKQLWQSTGCSVTPIRGIAAAAYLGYDTAVPPDAQDATHRGTLIADEHRVNQFVGSHLHSFLHSLTQMNYSNVTQYEVVLHRAWLLMSAILAA